MVLLSLLGVHLFIYFRSSFESPGSSKSSLSFLSISVFESFSLPNLLGAPTLLGLSIL